MHELALPVVYAAFLWWFTTGIVLLLDRQPRHTFARSLMGATVLGAAALYGLAVASREASVAGAYVAFTSAILVWGWLELTFLTGWITGPRKVGCPSHCQGWSHFVHAFLAIRHHELAGAAALAVVTWITWDTPNPVGLWTFLVLWIMRLSAKLNLHFGVRNLGIEFLPPHLAYLASYFRRRALNPLLPCVVILASAAVATIAQPALGAQADAYEIAARGLLSALLALAVLEHLFMVLPLPVARLWRWSLSTSPTAGTPMDPMQDEPTTTRPAILRGRL